jgi:hypothetical protein
VSNFDFKPGSLQGMTKYAPSWNASATNAAIFLLVVSLAPGPGTGTGTGLQYSPLCDHQGYLRVVIELARMFGESLGNLGTRYPDVGIDNHLAIGTS